MIASTWRCGRGLGLALIVLWVVAACGHAAAGQAGTAGTRTSAAAELAATQPILGYTQAAFTAALGPPTANSQAGILHYQACGTVDHYIVNFVDNHAAAILWQPCAGQHPSRDALQVAADLFLPAGSDAGAAFTTENGEPAVTYASPNLAGFFDASWFHDCAGNALPPGTFSLTFTSDGGWELAVGTCP